MKYILCALLISQVAQAGSPVLDAQAELKSQQEHRRKTPARQLTAEEAREGRTVAPRLETKSRPRWNGQATEAHKNGRQP